MAIITTENEGFETILQEANDVLLYWAVNSPKIERLRDASVEFVGLVDAFEAASNGITKSIIFFRRLVDRKMQISNRALNVMVTFKDWHDVQSDAEKVYSLLKEEMRGFLDFERPDLLFKEGMNLEKMREHVQADERFAHLDQIQVDKIEKEWKNLNLIPQLKDCIEEMEVLAAEVPKDAKWTSLWTGLN